MSINIIRYIVLSLFFISFSAMCEEVDDIYRAVKKGNMEEVRSLIAKGRDLNKDYGFSAGSNLLSIAADKDNYEMVKLLLTGGADANSTGPGKPPIFSTIRGSHGRLRYYEVDENSNISGLFIADLLIKHGADVNAVYHDETLLSRAARAGDSHLVNLLVKRGVDVNKYTHNKRMPSRIISPLHEAAGFYFPDKNSYSIIALLLAHGADVNLGYPQSPLRSALKARHPSSDVIRLLINWGAKTDLTDVDEEIIERYLRDACKN